MVSCEDLVDPAVAASSSVASLASAAGNAKVSIDMTDDEFEGFLDALNEDDDAVTAASAAKTSNDISDDEFENLLDQLHGSGKGPTASPAAESTSPSAKSNSDEISSDEFEALLDQLHGAGKAPTVKNSVTPAPLADHISDLEFEDLLDQLHGKGKPPVVAAELSGDRPQTTNASLAVPGKASSSPVTAKAPASSAVSTPATPKQQTVSAAPKARDNANPPPAQAQAAETTVRVDTQRLDDIMNMVGELVLVRNRLVRLGAESNNEAMQKAVANLDVVTADLQTSVMKTRMQPIKKVFGRFPRVVRDLARNLKKEINLELVGEDTDLDKNLVEALADPLVHLVRNSVDHGIELPAVREEHNKSRVGKIILAAEQEGDHILLSITDDGAGMDPQKLRDRAVEKGLYEADAAARLTDTEAFNLIFAPGFSTKVEISDVSGRGVGMDVVKTKITQLNGSIEIQSKVGEGTRINIKVPLTLAIMPTLMVMLGQQTFALPLVSVNEIFHMDLTKSNIVDGQECITIRERAVPIFHLKRWLVKKDSAFIKPKEGHVVIVSVGTQRVGFVVDQLIGQEEVVIKPLGKMLHGTPGMAGATITGDGTIALILDVPSMLKRYAGR